MAFAIKKATRTSQPILIGIWGGSSTGKTYSALRLARGLVGPSGKIGFIDTENNRALFYSGEVGGEWDHLDFQPPFTPERYIEAFKVYEQAGGYNCIIIDSASHVWEGEGGILDQADRIQTNGLAKWAKPKMAYKRMINALIRSNMHVIFLLRSKMGVTQVGKEIVSSGLEPIIEKNMIYEMTVSILLGADHKPLFQAQGDRYWVNPNIPAIKAPGLIKEAIRPGEYISEQTGEAIKKWLDGAQKNIMVEAERVASRGTEVFRAWWPSLSANDKKALNANIQHLQNIAKQADEEAIAANQEPIPLLESEENNVVEDNPFLETAQPSSLPVPPQSESAPAQSEKSLTMEAYQKMLRVHDWTWQMSDDMRSYNSGRDREEELIELAKQNGQAFVDAFESAQKQAYAPFNQDPQPAQRPPASPPVAPPQRPQPAGRTPAQRGNGAAKSSNLF